MVSRFLFPEADPGCSHTASDTSGHRLDCGHVPCVALLVVCRRYHPRARRRGFPLLSIQRWCGGSDEGRLAGLVGRRDNRFEFVDHCVVPRKNNVGKKLRFEGRNSCCRGCQLGVNGEGEGMPKPAGIEFKSLRGTFMSGPDRRFTRQGRVSRRTRCRKDDPELPSLRPERKGVQVPALTEKDVRSPGFRESAFYVLS